MKLIKLSGINCIYSFVDDEDFELVSQYKWHFRKTGNVIYLYSGSSVYLLSIGFPKTFSIHTLVMKTVGNDKGIKIDHIDHNGLNNQKSNLRICTSMQNSRNMRKLFLPNLTSIYKGVSLKHDCRIKWECRIKVNKKMIRIGRFETPELAALAYNKAAVKYFGEFAYLNIIQP